MSTASSSGDKGKPTPKLTHIARFEVRSVLGGGAFGVVYRAYDPQLEREVAIKVPRPGTLGTPKRVARFLGDAKSAAQLRHPHIVPVFDCGRDGELIYIAAAYVKGQTLAEAIDGPMEPRRAAAIVMKLAEALAYAHANGIVHRDVKPLNVVMDEQGEPHLIDFGLAQRGGETERGRMILGTPSYMSPEQAAGESGDAKPAFDQYALGVTLYELITGRTPFSGPSKMQQFHAVNTPPPPPIAVNPNTPVDLALICMKALSKHADNRYPDCAALASDLRTYLAGGVPSVRTLSARERVVRWARTEPKLAAAVGLVGLLVVALALVGGAFGVVQARNNRALAVQKRAADEARDDADRNRGLAEERERLAVSLKAQADDNAVKAVAAKALADDSARRATAGSAAATFDKAVALGEQGEVGQCLTELANALELAERADDKDLARVIRQNLAGWRRQLNRLSAVHPVSAPPSWLAFHPDPKQSGTVLFGSATGAGAVHMATCELNSGAIAVHVAGAEPTRAAATSPDRTLLLTISHAGTARVFNATTGAAVGRPINPIGAKFLAGAIIDERRIVLGTADGFVVPYRFANEEWEGGKEVSQRVLGRCEVRAVAVHPDGKMLLTASSTQLNGRIVLRRADDLQPVGEVASHGESLLPVTAIAFSPDGATFATGHGTLLTGVARVWDTKSLTPRPGGILRHQSEVYAVAFSPDGRFLATASQDRSALVFDAATLARVGQPLWHGGDVLAVAFSPDGRRLVTAGREEALRVWELAPGATARAPLQVRGAVVALAAHQPSNQLFTGGLSSNRVWDPRDFRERPLSILADIGSVHPVLAATYSSNGAVLLVGSAQEAALFDRQGERIGTALKHPQPVIAVAFNPADDKWFATGCADGIARLYQRGATDGPVEFVHTRDKTTDLRLYAVRFSPDGKYLLTGGTDRRTVLWEVATRKQVAELSHPDVVLSAAFSPDGKWIAIGYAGAAELWDRGAAGAPVFVGLFPHGPAGIVSVDVSADGASILTGGTDGTARLWDRKTRKPLGPMWRPGSTAKHVVFWSGGSQMMIAGTDLYAGSVTLLDRPPVVDADRADVALWVRAITGVGAELTVLEPLKARAAITASRGRTEPKIEAVIRAERPLAPPKPPPEPKVEPKVEPKPDPEVEPKAGPRTNGPFGPGAEWTPFAGLTFLGKVLSYMFP